MAHDPVGDAAIGPLREILERYRQVVNVLVSAVNALEDQVEPLSEMTETRSQSTHGSHPGVLSFEKGHDSQAILAFQERLSEVLGVATVTLEGSSADGFRFLVEMDKPPH